MDSNIVSFVEAYLSNILNLNILLITAGGILLVYQNKTLSSWFFLGSLFFSFISIIITVLVYKNVLTFLLKLRSPIERSFLTNFDWMEFIFWFDIAAIFLISIGLLLYLIGDKKCSKS